MNQVKTKKEVILEYYKNNGVSDEILKDHVLFDTGHILFQSKDEKIYYSGTWFKGVGINVPNYDIICKEELKDKFYYFLPSELKKKLDNKKLTSRELIKQQIGIKYEEIKLLKNEIRMLENEIVSLKQKEAKMCDSDGHYEENIEKGYLIGRRYFFEQFMDADTGRYIEINRSEIIKKEKI